MTSKRSLAVVLVAIAAYPLFALAQTPAKPSVAPDVQAAEPTLANLAALRGDTAAALLRKRVSVDWSRTNLEDVLIWLKEQTKDGPTVNIFPQIRALGVHGIYLEDPVVEEIRANDVTVAEVLNQFLNQLQEESNATYRAVGNKLYISTKQDFEKDMHVRVYDVTDLLLRVPNHGQSAPEIDLERVNQGGGGGGGGGGQGVFGGGGGQGGQGEDEQDDEDDEEADEELEDLANAIRAMIAPGTWYQDAQGNQGIQLQGQAVGRIEIYNRALIIRHSIEVHEQIGGGFDMDG